MYLSICFTFFTLALSYQGQGQVQFGTYRYGVVLRHVNYPLQVMCTHLILLTNEETKREMECRLKNLGCHVNFLLLERYDCLEKRRNLIGYD